MSWVYLACVLGAPKGVRGASWRCLGAILGVLGRSWKGFGESWRLPGSLLEAFLDNLLESSAICANSEKPRKNNGFSLIFEVPGRFRGQTNRKNT